MRLSTLLTGNKTYLAAAATILTAVGAYVDKLPGMTLGNLIVASGTAVIGAMLRAGSKSDAQAAATVVLSAVPAPEKGPVEVTGKLTDAVSELMDTARAVSGTGKA